MGRLRRRACRCRTLAFSEGAGVTPALLDLPKDCGNIFPTRLLRAPSLLTPGLLAQWKNWPGKQMPLCALAWTLGRMLWNAPPQGLLFCNDIAEAIRQSGKLPRQLRTNQPLDRARRHPLALYLEPGPQFRGEHSQRCPEHEMRPLTLVRFLRQISAEAARWCGCSRIPK